MKTMKTILTVSTLLLATLLLSCQGAGASDLPTPPPSGAGQVAETTWDHGLTGDVTLVKEAMMQANLINITGSTRTVTETGIELQYSTNMPTNYVEIFVGDNVYSVHVEEGEIRFEVFCKENVQNGGDWHVIYFGPVQVPESEWFVRIPTEFGVINIAYDTNGWTYSTYSTE